MMGQPLVARKLGMRGPAHGDADFGAAMQGAGVMPLIASPAPCVYRGRAAEALGHAHVAWAVVVTSPSFAGCAAAVAAGFGYAFMPRGIVPPVLRALEDGWPSLAEVEIALLGAAQLAGAT